MTLTDSDRQVLDPPRAHGGPAGSGRLRTVPEDFVVREWLGFEPDGAGDHWLLTVRKRGANTHWVAKQLAQLGQISPRDVGFAGLKDRNAVTEQSFTVPVRSAVTQWIGVGGEGFEVLTAHRHRRKLKRGALRGNVFEIALRAWRGESQVLEARLAALAAHGVPNYFGPQRFGRGGHNLAMAHAWFSSGSAPQDRLERSFALSAARSAIFNAVLAERVMQRTWNTLLPGDIANLNGSGSIFAADVVDEILTRRCSELDVHPTGPLWGSAAAPRRGVVADLEQAIAGRYAALSDGLVSLGVAAERRALRMPVYDLRWSIAEDCVQLGFRLPRGAFATALLHELIDSAFAQPALDSED